ncbi:Aspartate/glutamate leucyltransferase [Azospirillaceae bacterium]
MSIIDQRIQPLQQFFRSAPMPCPYLQGRIERKLFTRLTEPSVANEVNSALAQAGFRRSHDVVYRPVCPSCAACVPVRIPVDQFCMSRSFRRVLKRNADLTTSFAPAYGSQEHYALFANYQNMRHHESDMARMTEDDYFAMVVDGRTKTYLSEARNDQGTLFAVMLIDSLADGFSAVYSFFRAEDEARSLGSFMVLKLIEHCRAVGLSFVYLGYWISDSRKMSYKVRFQPLEMLGEDGWRSMALAEVKAKES